MLKEKEKVLKQATLILDAAMIVLAFFAAYYLRARFHVFYKLDLIPSAQVVKETASLREYLSVMFAWVPLWVLMLSLNGMYSSFRTRSFLDTIWVIIKSAVLSALSFAALAFVFKIGFVSRVFFVMFTVLATLSLFAEKWIAIAISRNIRKRGSNFRRLLIVGTGPRAGRFIEILGSKPEWGYKIVGLIDDEESRIGKEFFGIKVIGMLKDMPRILSEKVVDEVIFIVPRMWLDRLQESIAVCELLGIQTSVASDLFNLKIAKAHQSELEGFPLLVFETTFGREWQLFIKRVLDIVVSSFGIIILAPFLAVIAILVKWTSPGPVLFKQKRETLNGRIFTLYKFRSMHKDAKERLSEVMALNEMTGPVFKAKDDPRITPFGKFLRKTSIDEFPQLFNILVGQMSLVGPRPPIPYEVTKYELWQRRRLSMRSGLTCLWQISGRSRVGFEEWMELDMEYIDSWSLWLDFKILVRTVPVVLFWKGAQ
ncbi:MAG: sugar transferase [Candidatus Omnitrophica bacterium]|nr:sugar transferase [Candidatus Omnitrophota bacterium]